MEGLWRMNAMNFLTNFDVSAFALTWGAGASSLVSGSLTREIGSCINFKSVFKVGREKEFLGLPVLPSY